MILTERKTPPKDWRDSVEGIVQAGKFFAIRRTTLDQEEMVKLARTEFGIDGSTINKLMMIAEHPILSDPQYYGNLPAAWGKLYELKFLPEKKLLEIIKSGEAKTATKYRIWEIRGVKIKNGVAEFPANTKLGSRVNANIDAGMSLTDYIRSGIAKEKSEGITIEDAGKSLRISGETYRKIRSLILLSEFPELSEVDRTLVMELLEKVDKTRNIRNHYQEALPLIERVWGTQRNKKFNENGMKKRVDAFRSAVIIMGHSCERLAEFEIPYMSEDDINQSIDELTNASRLIRKVAETLRRSKDG